MNSAGPGSAKTALHWAAKKGHVQVVKFLVSSKAEINVQDSQGNTPLIAAIQSTDGALTSRLEIMRHLLENQANPLIYNHERRSALMALVVIRGSDEVTDKPNMQKAVQEIIRMIKQVIALKAQKDKRSVFIKPNGDVEFMDTDTMLKMNVDEGMRPQSGQIAITVLGTNEGDPVNITPHL